MRVLTSQWERPLNRLAVGAGHVAAASWVDRLPNDAEVWELATGTVCFTHRIAEARGESLAFTPDGRRLYLPDGGRLCVWDATTGGSWPGSDLGLKYADLSFSADGRRLVVTELSDDRGAVQCWRVTGDREFVQEWAAGPRQFTLFRAPAVSPDGLRVALSMYTLSDRTVRTLEVWNGGFGQPLHHRLLDPADPVEQLAFTADGARVLARFRDRTVRVFDAANGAPAGELVHKGRSFVTGVAVHPGGHAILTTRNDGTAQFWDPATLREARAFDWKLGPLVSAAFGPDGALAAAGTADGQVVLWDVDV